MSDTKEGDQVGQGSAVAPVPPQSPTKSWVQFDDETSTASSIPDSKQQEDSPAAVINTESVQVHLERSLNKSLDTSNNVAILDPKPLRNVELPIATVEPIVQGFSKTFHLI